MKSKAEPVNVNIGEASALTAISPKMIRHYEGLGLLPHPPRTDTGYRLYNEDALNSLHFIRRARDMGFGIPEIGQLLDLWHNRRRSSATVKKMAQAHIDTLQKRIDALDAMKRSLEDLVYECRGDHRSSCPILDDLAGGSGKTKGGGKRRAKAAK